MICKPLAKEKDTLHSFRSEYTVSSAYLNTGQIIEYVEAVAGECWSWREPWGAVTH